MIWYLAVMLTCYHSHKGFVFFIHKTSTAVAENRELLYPHGRGTVLLHKGYLNLGSIEVDI